MQGLTTPLDPIAAIDHLNRDVLWRIGKRHGFVVLDARGVFRQLCFRVDCSTAGGGV